MHPFLHSVIPSEQIANAICLIQEPAFSPAQDEQKIFPPAQ